MNNPLEAVTQAVNSLVTALKLPDESAKANEVLGEMSFPQFSRLLPYRDYNQESGLFMNDTTMGFMLEAIPINGANESIVEALDHMLRTKLPRGIPLCIHLMSSQLVGDRIEYGLREFSWSGEQAERFNAITRAYYMKAAATQFPLPEGMNLPLTLRHYRACDGGQLRDDIHPTGQRHLQQDRHAVRGESDCEKHRFPVPESGNHQSVPGLRPELCAG